MELLTFGETLVCLAADGGLPATATLDKSIGGTESNTAIGLARLGHDVAWISRLGEDPFGDEVLRTLRGEGVDVSQVMRMPHAPTGLMIKERRSPDEVHVFYYRAGSAASLLDEDDVPEALVTTADRVHVTGVTLALGDGPRSAVHKALAICKANEIPVSFDPNLRRKLWSDGEVVAACEAVFPYVSDLLVNDDEAVTLAGAQSLEAALTHFDGFGFGSVVVKRGSRGVVGRQDGRTIERPAHPVLAVADTVGAGDAFNAGYLHAVLQGDSFETALECGNWVASRVVAHTGDYEGLPTLREYQDHIDGRETIDR